VDSAQLLALVGALRGRCVAVVGDVVADEFVYGRVARVSREAPVLILEYDSTEIVPGGAGNAANNVASLGGTAALAAVVGRDEPGQRLLRALHKRVDSRRVVRAAARPTPVKTRILAGGIHSAKQQVVRIDRGVANGFDDRARAAFERQAMAAWRQESAAAKAASASIAMKAFRRGCHSAIRCRQERVTSRDETSLVAIALATATSDIRAGSVLMSTPSRIAPAESLRARDRTARCRRPAQSLRTQARSNWRYARLPQASRARPRHPSLP